MIIAIFANINKNHSRPVAVSICEFLARNGVQVVAEDDTAAALSVKKLSEIDSKSVDFIISLGGDGSILRVFHTHPDLDAPILGINMGGLGFMADIPIEDIYPSLENLVKGNYSVQDRIMMDGAIVNNPSNFAINEITFHRAQNPSLIDLAIYVDGVYLNTFSADGVIISTPNGSTAYSLAAGGPIVSPELDAIIITPICPHTISNRPIVLMPKHEIQVRYISEYAPIEVNYDGFSRITMQTGEVFSITKSSRKFRSVHMVQYDYFSTVRTKLGWTGKLKKG